jgi:hypothetical protein
MPMRTARAVNAFVSYRVVAADVERCLQIRAALKQRGIETHGDWELSAGPDYKPQLHAMIRAADAFVVLMSPESVASQHVNDEISYAGELKKRILPVLIAYGIDEQRLRKELAQPQWTRVRATDDFDLGIDALVQALETDFDLTAVHTWLTQRAEAWDGRRRAQSALLNRREVKEATDWLPLVSANTRKFPNVTPLQQEFITASESARVLWLRRLVGIVAAVALVLAGLGITAAVYAVRATNEAVRAENEAERAQTAEGTAEKEAQRARTAEGEARREAVRASGEAARADRERDSARESAAAERRARLEEEKQRAFANEQRVAAEEQRAIATTERDLARRQALGNAAYALSERDPTLAVQFARLAGIAEKSGIAAIALLKAVNTGSWLYSHRIDDALDADLSADGRLLAWIDRSQSLHVLEIDAGNKPTIVKVDASHVKWLHAGRLLTWTDWDATDRKGTISVIDASGGIVGAHQFEFNEPTVCESGRIYVPSVDRSTRERRTVVHAIDSRTAALTTFKLPSAVEHLDLKAACLPDERGIIAFQTIPGLIAVARTDGSQEVIGIPDGYHASDIAVDPRSRQAALYLTGALRGVTDAVGRIDLSADGVSTQHSLEIVPLPESPGFDSGGVIAFLPDGRVVAASTDGWTRVIDFTSVNQAVVAARQRAVDRIAMVPSSGEFVMARRSGRVTIFDSRGVATGQLLGEFHSDGQNPVFSRVASSSAGDRVLTVSRNGARLWRRPRYQLTIPRTASYRRSDKAPDFAARAAGDLAEVGTACRSTATIKVDDVGQLSLCVQISNRTEYFDLGLTKDDIAIRSAGPVDSALYRLTADDVERLFILSPSPALRLMEQDDRDRRLWSPDANTINSWVQSEAARTAAQADAGRQR